MDFFAASKGNINPNDLVLFAKIKKVVSAVPNIIFDPNERNWEVCKNQISCHLICRALARCFEVRVLDGHFAENYQHSWLIPASGTSIIDVYPVAGASPFIVSRDAASPWIKLYKESERLQAMFATDVFEARLEQTIMAVGGTVSQLDFARE